MSVSRYAYVNARISGMKSRLLDETTFKELVESRNIADMAAQLKNTAYSDTVSGVGLLSMEVQLKQSLYKDYLKILDSVRGQPRVFIQATARRFEVEVLKSIIRMKFLKANFTEYLLPFGEMTQSIIDKLVKADNIAEAVEAVRFTDYYDPLKKVQPHQEETEEIQEMPYINALDTHYYAAVTGSIAGLSARDRGVASRFVGLNVDLTNFLTALRLRGIDSGLAAQYFLEGGKEFSRVHFSRVASLEEFSQLPDMLPRKYKETVAEAMEGYKTGGSISFDIAAKKLLLKESKKMFLGDRFHIGTLIAYLYLKENEVANLIKIVKTKDEQFNPKEIYDLLVMV